MSRLKGKTIKFEVDNVEYSGSVKNVTFSSEVGEMGFGDYADNLEYRCQIEGFQDYAANSLWSKLFDAPGATIALEFTPHGNATPTASQPKFTASGYAEVIPVLGGTAGEYFVWDVTIILDGKPAKVTA
jgi:hypothetical protein